MTFRITSNAKINLFLDVLYKRKDGYHQIESIFLPIDFKDEFTIEISDGVIQKPEDIIFTSNIHIPLDNYEDYLAVSERGDFKKNIIYSLIKKIIEWDIPLPKLKIHLEKNIPTRGGLGGGSSNAGALLRFLLEKKFISDEQAYQIAIELGSDVPFFLLNTPSFVTGRGEILLPIDKNHFLIQELEELEGILCINSFSVSTGGAYQLLNRPVYENFNKNYISTFHLIHEYSKKSKKDKEQIFQILKNDFEEVVFKMKNEILEIFKKVLETLPFYLRMTGSGSSLFAFYQTDKKKLEALLQLKKLEELYGRKVKFLPFKIINTGQWPSGKASDFGSDIRRFESSLPSN